MAKQEMDGRSLPRPARRSRVDNPEPFTWWDIDFVPTFLYLTAVLDSTP